MNALEITNLQKTYDNGHVALNGVDLTVAEGDFFALLGPNGAGKSTAIGIIASLINKTAGDVKIFGKDVTRETNACKLDIGLVPQEINFNLFEKPRDILITQAGFYGVKRSLASERAEKYLKLLELWEKHDRPAREMSGGMKRRLMIARALVHEPRLLILDEPTAGVDIEIRRSMWEFIEEINRKGTTIILTTHYLEEAETLCRNVAVIDGGKVVEQGAVSDLLSRSMVQTFVLDLKESAVVAPQLTGYDVVSCEGLRLEVRVALGQPMNDLFQQLQVQGFEVMSMRNKSNRLEEFFLRLVKQSDAEVA